MKILCDLIIENADIYKAFLELEYEKYKAVIEDDVITLDTIVSQEEVLYMKLKGIEQKRQKHMQSLAFKDRTLKEVIDTLGSEYKTVLQEQLDNLSNTINELKKINNILKTVIEVRLRRIDKEMTNLGEGEKPKGGLLISKKI